MRHLGPFWCIKTAIFSENDNLSKTGFREKFYTHTYTEYWVQLLSGFVIFHTPLGTHEVWKIAKKRSPIGKFGCVSVRKFAYFFQKMRFFLQKIVKNTKKMIKIFFLSKKYTLVPKLSYMFYEKYFMK